MADSTAATASPDPATRPVFLGGSGFAGANLIAEMLGKHSEFAVMFPADFEVFAGPDGFFDAVRFGRALARGQGPRPWWRRVLRRPTPPPGPAVGETRTPPEGAVAVLREARAAVRGSGSGLDSMPEAEFDNLVADYLTDFWRDPESATRTLGAQIGSAASRSSARRWIDTSRLSALRAKTACAVFPDARVLHVVRDGRDVAADLLQSAVVPTPNNAAHVPLPDYLTALAEWERRVTAAAAGLGRAPAHARLVVRVESLVGADRDRIYDKLLVFLRVEDQQAMRAFFDRRFTDADLAVGRWRDVVAESDQAEVDRRYQEILANVEPSLGEHRAP